MKTHLQARRRAAFTLVELMLAVAIMLVLAAILVAAVYKVLGTTKQVTTAQDIRELQLALESFKGQYGFYPPSRLKLCAKQSEYGTTQLDVDSQAWLTRMFPKITDPNNSPWVNAAVSPGWIQWDGQYGNPPSSPPVEPSPVILEGDQCLTFFLGGIPTPLNPPTLGASYNASQTYALTGFSQNPYNPAAQRTQQGEVRISFFDFTSYANEGRLVVLSTLPPVGAPPTYPASTSFSSSGTSFSPAGVNRSLAQPSLLDVYTYKNVPYDKNNLLQWRPYLYFSSYKAADGYNRYKVDGSLATNGFSSGTGVWTDAWTDCPTFTDPRTPDPSTPSQYYRAPAQPPVTSPTQTVGVWPYVANVNASSGYITFQNSNTFQIVCAGKDGLFGSGSDQLLTHIWPPAASAYSLNDPSINDWKDDQSNFCATVMGISR